MAGWRSVFVSVMVSFVVAAVVHADLMPVCGPEAGGKSVAHRGETCDHFVTPCPSLVDDGLGPPDLTPIPDEWIRLRERDLAGPAEVRHHIGLTDRSTGSDLCLYGLLAAGLCGSGRWVRRLSCSFVPDWYHLGGPFQIGHSTAIAPDSVCRAVVCFVQPDSPRPQRTARHRPGTIIALWRRSQFTPGALTSRAPPCMP